MPFSRPLTLSQAALLHHMEPGSFCAHDFSQFLIIRYSFPQFLSSC